jgi:hypothetical protein
MMRISMAVKRTDDETSPMKPKSSASSETAANLDRKKRLADELRANLQKRKAQARSRRTGEADSRQEGIAAAADQSETDG